MDSVPCRNSQSAKTSWSRLSVRDSKGPYQSLRKPITMEMLRKWVASIGPNPSQSDVRLATIALVAFAAFLRADEIVRFTQHGMDLTIASS